MVVIQDVWELPPEQVKWLKNGGTEELRRIVELGMAELDADEWDFDFWILCPWNPPVDVVTGQKMKAGLKDNEVGVLIGWHDEDVMVMIMGAVCELFKKHGPFDTNYPVLLRKKGEIFLEFELALKKIMGKSKMYVEYWVPTSMKARKIRKLERKGGRAR